MKKYIAGMLLLAGLAIAGGLQSFKSQPVLAAPTCNPNTYTAHCEGSTYYNCGFTGTDGNGNPVGEVLTTANSPLCGAITVGGGGASSGTIVGTRPVLTWTPSLGATYYIVQVSDKADFSNIVFQKQVTGNTVTVQ